MPQLQVTGNAALLEQILDILEKIEQDKRRSFELGSVNKLSVLQIETPRA
jgi:hypothetical protein